MDVSNFPQSDDEETILEIRDKINNKRKQAWNNFFKRFSVDGTDESLSVEELGSPAILNKLEGLHFDEEQKIEELSDGDDIQNIDPSIMELSMRWTAICARMDTTNVCNFCSMQGNLFNLTKCESEKVDMTELSNDKSLESDGYSKLEENSDDDGIVLKIKDIPDVVAIKNTSDIAREQELIKGYVNETNCQFTKKQIASLITYIETEVGSELKDLGLLINSEECKSDPILYEKVKEELADVVNYLMKRLTTKAICLYGSYQSWRINKITNEER